VRACFVQAWTLKYLVEMASRSKCHHEAALAIDFVVTAQLNGLGGEPRALSERGAAHGVQCVDATSFLPYPWSSDLVVKPWAEYGQ